MSVMVFLWDLFEAHVSPDTYRYKRKNLDPKHSMSVLMYFVWGALHMSPRDWLHFFIFWHLGITLIMQHPRSLWIILERTWLREKLVEEQTGAESWRCRHCRLVRAGVLCMVLCRWDRRKRVYIHRLLCLRSFSVIYGRDNDNDNDETSLFFSGGYSAYNFFSY